MSPIRTRKRPAFELGEAVDNPSSFEIVRRELDPDAVAEQHPDAVPLHPSGRIAEQHVSVVEPDLEHAVAERLDDLALQLDLVLLLCDHASSSTRVAEIQAPVRLRQALATSV